MSALTKARTLSGALLSLLLVGIAGCGDDTSDTSGSLTTSSASMSASVPSAPTGTLTPPSPQGSSTQESPSATGTSPSPASTSSPSVPASTTATPGSVIPTSEGSAPSPSASTPNGEGTAGQGGGGAGPGETESGGSSAGGSTPTPNLPDAGVGGSTPIEPEPEPVEPEPEYPNGIVSLFPIPGSEDLCSDPMLRLSFDQSVHLGDSGAFVVSEGGQTVARVDLSQGSVSVNVGGSNVNIPPPAFVVDDPTSPSAPARNTVVVSLVGGSFDDGRSYQVSFDGSPVLGDQSGGPVTLEGINWTFTTRAAASGGGGELSVGQTSTSDFCTVQGALNAAANDTVITIGPGAYPGLVRLSKNGITLRGTDRDQTVLLGINNNNLNPSTRGRPLIFGEDISDLTIETLTIRNLTEQGGSQAEALALLSCDRCTVRDATIESLQDTLLWSGSIYARDSLIIGNVDYIWGDGAAFFDRCEVRTVGRKGYNLQARNGAGYGFIFVNSKLTADPGITGDILARIDVAAYPASQVAYIDCEMGSHIAPEGWVITGGGSTNQLRFWEYNSHRPDGSPVDLSQRADGSRELTEQEAAPLRDPATVLGGWNPPAASDP